MCPASLHHRPSTAHPTATLLDICASNEVATDTTCAHVYTGLLKNDELRLEAAERGGDEDAGAGRAFCAVSREMYNARLRVPAQLEMSSILHLVA